MEWRAHAFSKIVCFRLKHLKDLRTDKCHPPLPQIGAGQLHSGVRMQLGTEGYGYTVNRHWTLLRLMSGAVSETDGCQVIAQGKAEKGKKPPPLLCLQVAFTILTPKRTTGRQRK